VKGRTPESDMQEDSYAGLHDLVKKAIPLVSQIGAVAGGLVSLLAALEKVSGELTMALAGFMLVAATVASGIVIWGKTTRGAGAGHEAVSVPLFSAAHRRTAAIALAVTIVLLILFLVQVGVALSRPSGQGRFAINPSGPAGGARPGRATPTATVAPPLASTFTALPAAPSPVTGAAALASQGFAALSAQNYKAALDLFALALEADATSARAQLGLGEAYYFLANYRAAIPPLRLAAQLNPSLDEAHAYLGFAYEDSQDAVRARAEFEEYLRVAPADAPLRTQVEQRLRRNVAPTVPTGATTVRPTTQPTRAPSGN
jgi:hypothetical protein